MELVVRPAAGPPPGSLPVEVVERKGLGHPDTICDGIAEHFCARLCRHYLERFGVILHHNVDKILLVGGASRPAFGGGQIEDPIELYMAGRAVREFRSERIPVDDIAIDAAREWLRGHLHALDPVRHVEVFPRLRPGSADLTRIFEQGLRSIPLANDTSCGVGFAPGTDLERVVLAVERALNDAQTKRLHPEIGEDIKIMGIRNGSRIRLTVGCAFVGGYVSDLHDYDRKKREATAIALAAARRVTRLNVDVVVNVADDIDAGHVFLTVTGTSAEGGDDGEVGRGNRTSGLITPFRPMTLEAAAGKNPVTHVGKLYGVIAGRIAARAAGELGRVGNVTVLLVSDIGRPVADPRLVDVQLATDGGKDSLSYRAAIENIVRAEMDGLPALTEALVRGELAVY